MGGPSRRHDPCGVSLGFLEAYRIYWPLETFAALLWCRALALAFPPLPVFSPGLLRWDSARERQRPKWQLKLRSFLRFLANCGCRFATFPPRPGWSYRAGPLPEQNGRGRRLTGMGRSPPVRVRTASLPPIGASAWATPVRRMGQSSMVPHKSR